MLWDALYDGAGWVSIVGGGEGNVLLDNSGGRNFLSTTHHRNCENQILAISARFYSAESYPDFLNRGGTYYCQIMPEELGVFWE